MRACDLRGAAADAVLAGGGTTGRGVEGCDASTGGAKACWDAPGAAAL
jgi:hypothetical protein